MLHTVFLFFKLMEKKKKKKIQRGTVPALCGLFIYHQRVICYSHSKSRWRTWCWIFSHNTIHHINFTDIGRRVFPPVATKSARFNYFTMGTVDNYLKQSPSIIVSKYEWGFLMLLWNNGEYWTKLSRARWCLPLWVNCQVWWMRLFLLCIVSLY